MGRWKFLWASKLWKLPAQLASIDFSQSFSPDPMNTMEAWSTALYVFETYNLPKLRKEKEKNSWDVLTTAALTFHKIIASMTQQNLLRYKQ